MMIKEYLMDMLLKTLQGATNYGVLNRGSNLNGRIIDNSLSELVGKPFIANQKSCYQYTFQAYEDHLE